MDREKIEKTYPRPKLNGYRAWHRNIWLFVASGKLSTQAIFLYQFLIDQADFDINHSNFSLVEINYSQISLIFHKSSQNTIRSWLHELLKIGFISKENRRNWYKVNQMNRYLSPGVWKGEAAVFSKIENNQSIETIIQFIATGTHSVDQNTQSTEEIYEILTQEDHAIATGSSKVKSSISPSTFGDEDKEWINKHIK